eukprot:g16842.t1
MAHMVMDDQMVAHLGADLFAQFMSIKTTASRLVNAQAVNFCEVDFYLRREFGEGGWSASASAPPSAEGDAASSTAFAEAELAAEIQRYVDGVNSMRSLFLLEHPSQDGGSLQGLKKAIRPHLRDLAAYIYQESTEGGRNGAGDLLPPVEPQHADHNDHSNGSYTTHPKNVVAGGQGSGFGVHAHNDNSSGPSPSGAEGHDSNSVPGAAPDAVAAGGAAAGRSGQQDPSSPAEVSSGSGRPPASPWRASSAAENDSSADGAPAPPATKRMAHPLLQYCGGRRTLLGRFGLADPELESNACKNIYKVGLLSLNHIRNTLDFWVAHIERTASATARKVVLHEARRLALQLQSGRGSPSSSGPAEQNEHVSSPSPEPQTFPAADSGHGGNDGRQHSTLADHHQLFTSSVSQMMSSPEFPSKLFRSALRGATAGINVEESECARVHLLAGISRMYRERQAYACVLAGARVKQHRLASGGHLHDHESTSSAGVAEDPEGGEGAAGSRRSPPAGVAMVMPDGTKVDIFDAVSVPMTSMSLAKCTPDWAPTESGGPGGGPASVLKQIGGLHAAGDSAEDELGLYGGTSWVPYYVAGSGYEYALGDLDLSLSNLSLKNQSEVLEDHHHQHHNEEEEEEEEQKIWRQLVSHAAAVAYRPACANVVGLMRDRMEISACQIEALQAEGAVHHEMVCATLIAMEKLNAIKMALLVSTCSGWKNFWAEARTRPEEAVANHSQVTQPTRGCWQQKQMKNLDKMNIQPKRPPPLKHQKKERVTAKLQPVQPEELREAVV